MQFDTAMAVATVLKVRATSQNSLLESSGD